MEQKKRKKEDVVKEKGEPEKAETGSGRADKRPRASDPSSNGASGSRRGDENQAGFAINAFAKRSYRIANYRGDAGCE